MYFEAGVTIDRPMEQVFTYASDPSNLFAWRVAIRSAERTSTGPVEAGAQDVIRFRLLGRTFETSSEIVSWDPPLSYSVRYRDGPIPSMVHYTFTSNDGTTEVRAAVEAQPRGLFRHLSPLLKWRFQNNLARLKTVLEMPPLEE